MLAHSEYGAGPVAVLVHGLLGRGRNLALVARELGKSFNVFCPDMRNHGKSFHSPGMGYGEMAKDLISFMDGLGIDSAFFMGHSMGGKAVMKLAFDYPDRVDAMAVADIAPRAYSLQKTDYIEAMLAMDLPGIQKRPQADKILAKKIYDPVFRGFLLQNLRRSGKGQFAWQANLEAIDKQKKALSSNVFGSPYLGPALFLQGEKSDYIREADKEMILSLFPDAKFSCIANAGHLVHYDAPGPFTRTIEEFFKKNLSLKG